MPVDPSDVHASRRQPNQLFEKYKAQLRLRRASERRGTLTLASVPSERTVGDAFRLMLETCEKSGYMSTTGPSSLPKHLRELEHCVDSVTRARADTDGEASSPTRAPTTTATLNATQSQSDASIAFSSPFYAVGLSIAREAGHRLLPHASPDADPPPAVRAVDATWEMLDRTALNAPVHGALALRGKSLVETRVLRLAYRLYPRLRSRHVQQLLHQTCGLLPCGEIAVRLGFAELAQVSAEVSMWRELNVLHERMRVARVQAAAHRQRVEQGVAQQRRWYWRAVLRSAAARLHLFPVHREDLEPRLEWIRQSLFAFVAFVHLAEASGDGGVRVQPLIERLFCPALADFASRCDLLAHAQRLVAEAAEGCATGASGAANPSCATESSRVFGGKATADTKLLFADAHVAATSSFASPTGDPSIQSMGGAEERSRAEVLEKDKCASYTAALQSLTRELARVESRTADEEEIIDGVRHPLNHRSALRAAQLCSSGGTHAVQGLYNDIFTDYHVVRHRRVAPALILDCLRVVNAFKEAQLILKYAPQVRAVLRRSPIDVDQVVRKVVEVRETNSYASMYTAQQYRAVEYTVCRLYSGKQYCLGEGKGETLMEAMQEAAHHMVFNYYVRSSVKSLPPSSCPTNGEHAPGEEERVCGASGEEGDAVDAKLPRVNMGKPRTEEEIFF